jgi:hypothetical protein
MPRPFRSSAVPRTALWSRFLVVLLALLQVVAPTWHVCDMGGHCASMSRHAGGHHEDYAEGSSNTPLRPFICACAGNPNQHPVPANWPKWNEHLTGHDDPFCLARLLQTMPATQAAGMPPLVIRFVSLPAEYVATPSSSPKEAPGDFPARGPPSFSL